MKKNIKLQALLFAAGISFAGVSFAPGHEYTFDPTADRLRPEEKAAKKAQEEKAAKKAQEDKIAEARRQANEHDFGIASTETQGSRTPLEQKIAELKVKANDALNSVKDAINKLPNGAELKEKFADLSKEISRISSSSKEKITDLFSRLMNFLDEVFGKMSLNAGEFKNSAMSSVKTKIEEFRSKLENLKNSKTSNKSAVDASAVNLNGGPAEGPLTLAATNRKNNRDANNARQSDNFDSGINDFHGGPSKQPATDANMNMANMGLLGNGQ